jgi:tyrosine-protein phosphatase SIW14
MNIHTRLVLLTAILTAGTVCLADPRGVPPQAGITNFGKVNETLYRGAQPGPAQIVTLKQMGVKSIINLRTSDDAGKAEALMAQTNGLVYTNIPLNGISRPTDDQVRLVLGLIETLPSPVFVHCQHGCDRTGTIIACYRIQHDDWTAKAALTEAEKYGISRLERGMRHYIADFGKAKAKANKANKPAETATPSRDGQSK